MIGEAIWLRRVWSLWEMLELKAGAFTFTASQLASTTSYISAVSRGTSVGQIFHADTRLDDRDRAFLDARLSSLFEHIDTLGARVTALAVKEAQTAIGYSDATWGVAQARFGEITNTLKRELSLVTVLVLEPKEQIYFSPNEPHFGSQVATNFQTTAAFEIDEAAKCLALGRSTAAVFHLMRVMEIGIRAIARCLGIPDPTRPADRNWGNILRDLKGDLDARAGQAPTKVWTKAGDREIFESAYTSLDAVRVAWRNTTIHVENKYTPEEAEHVLGAVKGFMMKLASRCDENGDPKA